MGILGRMETKLSLLIHADPGARSGFLAAWLTQVLNRLAFDSGSDLNPNFYKIHTLDNIQRIINFKGIKIRIRPTLTMIDLHCLLFLRKNVHTLIPDFTRDEFCLDTFAKLTYFTKELFENDSELDYSVYDYIINFEDTFDTQCMINLFQQINNKLPTAAEIDMLMQTNQLNSIKIEKNHSTSILKLCIEREQQLSLKESERFWSIVDVYNTVDCELLYDTVLDKIKTENYGIFLQ
jgi:hypothetical protein|tara:strand:- start:43 stop:750 length:708 start_codon:yes stop_codon:yes gene_type:complete